MPEVDSQGGVTVTLSADDLIHLLGAGRATVTKEVGPLQIKIRIDGDVDHKIIVDNGRGDVTVFAGSDPDE
jgi:hypothetical protein